VLFLGLAQLVSVPFDAPEVVYGNPINLPPPRADTPEVRKRDAKPVRQPPVLKPGRLRLAPAEGGSNLEPVTYMRPTPEARPRTPGLLRGIDGEVIPIVRPPPEYPPRLLDSGTEGWVRVQFTVTSIGTVRDAVVVDSEPGTSFDDAALKAIARWRYNPRVVNGEAVERVGLQTVIRFELEN
jgi:protein TonB